MKNRPMQNNQVQQCLTDPSKRGVDHVTKMLDEYNKAFMHGGVVTKTDPLGIITFVSQKFSELSGYLPSELIGKSHKILRHSSVHKSVFKDLWSTINKKEIWTGVLQNRKSNGESFFAHTTIIPILGIHDEIVEFLSMRLDVSELLSGRIIFQSSYKIDMLTGIGNRLKLFKDLANIRKPMIALINIRDFKEINSTYGLEGGDLILEQLAGLLQREALKFDMEAYRLDSDEFILLADKAVIHDSFADIIDDLVKLVEETPMPIDTYTIKIKINIGISLSHTDTLLYADIALKYAKKHHLVYSIADDTSTSIYEYRNTVLWKNKIIDGIKEDRFVPYYQPIIDNKTGRIESYEALIRLVEENIVISPVKFLEIAKYASLYSELTRIMIRKTFAYFQDIEARFSLNLTIEDIQNDKTRLYFKNMLYQYSGIQKRLTIEIVESEGIENFDEVTQFIKEMQHLGCKIAIDDFGTGYSNFEYLMKLNVNTIKIDGSLIQGMATSKNTFNIVETIVLFAQKNKLKTVAEFVSSAELYEKVKALGIDYSQGYYFKEPSPHIL